MFPCFFFIGVVGVTHPQSSRSGPLPKSFLSARSSQWLLSLLSTSTSCGSAPSKFHNHSHPCTCVSRPWRGLIGASAPLRRFSRWRSPVRSRARRSSRRSCAGRSKSGSTSHTRCSPPALRRTALCHSDTRSCAVPRTCSCQGSLRLSRCRAGPRGTAPLWRCS